MADYIEAVIMRIVNYGKDRSYAVTGARDGTDRVITFTVSEKAWKADFDPHRGMLVLLKGVYETEKGWRALSAKPKQNFSRKD